MRTDRGGDAGAVHTYGTLCSSVLRIENSNYNKGGSEFFVATGGREGVLSDWSSAAGLGGRWMAARRHPVSTVDGSRQADP